MAPQSKNPNIVFKNPDMRKFMKGLISVQQILDSGSGIAAGRICEFTSGEVKLGTEQNAAVMGVTRNVVAAGDPATVEFGFVPCMAGSPLAIGDRIAPRANGYIGKAQTAQATILSATAGDAFTNQPANDGVEVVSSSASDVTQTITLYGVLNGATTVLVTETIAITGTTQAVSVHTNWDTIFGARLSAACAGNITVREASGNATICTIAASSLTAGIHDAELTNAYGLIPRHDASTTSTAGVVLVGTGLDGAALMVLDALNSGTEEDHGTTPFATVTEIMLGAVASDVNVTILSNEASDASVYCGIALQATTVAGVPVDCWLKPYWM